MNDMTMGDSQGEFIVLRRQFKHSPERLFDAFAKPRSLECWMSPAESVETTILDHDFQVGGRYRIRYQIPGMATLHLRGEYLEISRAERLIFSWEWEAPDEHAGVESRVELSFLKRPGGTELYLKHSAYGLATFGTRHEPGWKSTLQRLDDWLKH